MQQDASSAIHEPDAVLRGGSIIAEIKASRIEFVVSVPDITTGEGLLHPLSQSEVFARGCKPRRRPAQAGSTRHEPDRL